jgi:hypothetical protein
MDEPGCGRALKLWAGLKSFRVTVLPFVYLIRVSGYLETVLEGTVEFVHFV